MADSIQKAFERHPRPQAPSVPHVSSLRPVPSQRSLGLTVQKSPSWVARPSKSRTTETESSVTVDLDKVVNSAKIQCSSKSGGVRSAKWLDFIQLGKLTQAQTEWLLCTDQHHEVYMFKSVDQNFDDKRLMSLQHRNVLRAKFEVETPVGRQIGFKFVRHTLEELLHVHLSMNDSQIGLIAKSVFEALVYLHSQDLLHGAVNVQSIRLCGRSGRILLGGCENCSTLANAASSSLDFEYLAMTLLECMEGSVCNFDVGRVREKRASNKVFGLSNGEEWSECKQLLDFLDSLIETQRRPLAKLSQHEYLSIARNERELIPLLELVPFECFSLWEGA